jgi:hypothetical protein
MSSMRQPCTLGRNFGPAQDLNDGTMMREPGTSQRIHVPPAKRFPSRGNTAPLPTLRWGAKGEDVSRLQRLLNNRIVPTPKLRIDGKFGNKTYAAVRVFQRLRGITVDGIVGPGETWPHLFGGKRVDRGHGLRKGLPDLSAVALVPAAPGAIQRQPVEIPETVWDWSFERKMREVVRLMPSHLKGRALRDFQALIHTESLILMLTFIALLGFLSGGLAIAMAALVLGTDIVTSLAACLQITANAASHHELDEAADELAHVVISGSTAVLLAAVRMLYVRAKGVPSKGTSPLEDKPTPTEQPTTGTNPTPPAKETAPAPAPKEASPAPPKPTPTPPTPALLRLRQLSRPALLKELREVTGDSKLRLWEQVEYGEFYHIVRAGAETAARLGIRVGDVIGYHQWSQAAMGFGGIMELSLDPMNISPYGDPFAG